MTRIHILLDEPEKERFRKRAQQEGKSLAAWLRDAARARLVAESSQNNLESLEDLQAFFAGCDEWEKGQEPDWNQHRKVIERSVRSGAIDT